MTNKYFISKGIKVFLVMGFCLILSLPIAEGKSRSGIVSHIISGCDYFIVETSMGYSLVEWYGGAIPDKGDILYGEFEQYGFQDVYNSTKDEEMRIWVEEYWLDLEDALEALLEECE
jgi:hypothetical protein